MCGATSNACLGNQVTAPQICSGNGILRKRENRDEYYCACGSPVSVLDNSTANVRQITELQSNGYGG